MRSTPQKLDEGYVSIIAGSPADITYEIKALSSTVCRIIAVTVPANLGGIACEIEKAIVNLAPIIEAILDREDDNLFDKSSRLLCSRRFLSLLG